MREDDTAASSVASFIVALGVFALTFSGITLFLTGHVAQTAPGENLDTSAKAQGGLDVLLGSTGTPAAWHTRDWDANQALEPDRIGLLESGSASTVDYDKLLRIQGALAGYSAVDETLLADAIGLPGYSLHLRTTPLFTQRSDGTIAWPDGYSVAYIANLTNLGTLAPRAENETGSLSRIHLDYTNSTVQTTPVAELLTSTPASTLLDGDIFADNVSTLKAHLIPRLAGFSHAYDESIPATPTCADIEDVDIVYQALTTLLGDCDSYLHLNYTYNNSYWKVLNVSTLDASSELPTGLSHVLTPSRFDRATPGGPLAWRYSYPDDNWIITPDIEVPDTLTTVTVHINQSVMGVDRSPSSEEPTFIDDHASLLVLCTSGCSSATAWTTADQWIANAATTPGDFQHNTTDLSSYRGKTIRLALRWNASAYITGAPVVLDQDFNQAGPSKGWFVANLTLAGHGDSGGATLWRNVFDYDPDLSQYDLLVVGSDADQSEYNNDGMSAPEESHVLRTAVTEWAKAGGRLLILGSTEQRNDWLFPEFVKSQGTGVAATSVDEDRSDLGHPLLTTPFRLDRTVLLNPAKASSTLYQPKEAAGAGVLTFDRILQDARGESFLAVTDPSTELDGAVVLTSLTPGAVASTERDRFFQNVIAYLRYRALYVDHGTPLAGANSAVGSSSRVVLVESPDPTVGTVELKVTLYSWR